MQRLTIQLLAISILSATACSNQASKSGKETERSEKASSYTWKKLLDSAEWKKSYNFQMLNIRDTLWTFHYDGNWYSVDGADWTKSRLPNAISNLAFLDYVVFKDAVLGLGRFEGNIEEFKVRPEIYSTKDLKRWATLSSESNLPRRFFYHPFVFQDKIWIIGGEDEHGKYSDIWNSDDGVAWTRVKDNSELGKRSRSQIVNLNGKLFLLDNDVWSSTDAINWTKEATEIVKGETVFGYAAVIYDNKIWLLGCNRNGQFSSQVFVSENGKRWEGENAPWTPRGGIAATVYKNKIYMTGGKYGGTPGNPDFRYSNDVWILSRTE